MKSVIVIYTPIQYTESSTHERRRRQIQDDNLKNLRDSELAKDFHFIIIEDPDRDKVETEIFFKPE